MENTKTEQMARELAVAIKDEILEKVKPGQLYRTGSTRHQFVYLTKDKSAPVLYKLDGSALFNPDSDYSLGVALHKAVAPLVKTEEFCLRSGCWKTTKCPVGSVHEATEDDLKKYFDSIQERVCELVKELVGSMYYSTAVQMGVKLPEPDNSQICYPPDEDDDDES